MNMNANKMSLLILTGVVLSGCGQRNATYQQSPPPMVRQVPMQQGSFGGGRMQGSFGGGARMRTQFAPMGGSSMGNVRVWVNLKTHVFHYPGSRGYGNTKYGRFETEQQAMSEGFRPAANGQ